MDRTPTRTTRKARALPPAGDPAAEHDAIALEARWRTGPRTRAWNDLWHRLLDGLVAAATSRRSAARDEEMPAEEACESPGAMSHFARVY